MAYQVVRLDEYRAAVVSTLAQPRPGARDSGGGRGRPRKYAEKTVSVSFRVPLTLIQQGRRKARRHRVNMTELFAYHYLSFVSRPAEDTESLLESYRSEYGPVAGSQDHARP